MDFVCVVLEKRNYTIGVGKKHNCSHTEEEVMVCVGQKTSGVYS